MANANCQLGRVYNHHKDEPLSISGREPLVRLTETSGSSLTGVVPHYRWGPRWKQKGKAAEH